MSLFGKYWSCFLYIFSFSYVIFLCFAFNMCNFKIDFRDFIIVFVSVFSSRFKISEKSVFYHFILNKTHTFRVVYWKNIPLFIVAFGVCSIILGSDHWAGIAFFSGFCVGLKLIVLLVSNGVIQFRDYFLL